MAIVRLTDPIMSTRDRRIDPRTPAKAPARLWAEGREVGIVQIADVSKSGLFVAHGAPDLPFKSQIKLEMVLGDSTFDLVGEVVHVLKADAAAGTGHAPGYGVLLKDPPPDLVARVTSVSQTVESVGLKPILAPRGDSRPRRPVSDPRGSGDGSSGT
jgi:hypothetical protein